jgi:protein-tyrosine phosphatase
MGFNSLRILFVCMGNICRSPTVEGMFRARLVESGLAGRYEVGSAGTHGYHIGAPPDERAQAAALRRGLDLSALRARPVEPGDFEAHDYIFAMDEDNLEWLKAESPAEHHRKLHLLLEFATGVAGWNVPDPYYGGSLGFERVLDLAEEAVSALLARLEAERSGS